MPLRQRKRLTRLWHRLTAHHARQTTPTQRLIVCNCGWKRWSQRDLFDAQKGGLPF